MVVPMSETVVRLRDNFMPGDSNHVGSIFGGKILSWMERAAKCCATHFTRNPHMVTIGIDKFNFKRAIFPTDLLELQAMVTYHTKHTVHIETIVHLIRDGEKLYSHQVTLKP